MSSFRRSILSPSSSKPGSKASSRSNSRAPKSKLLSSPGNDSEDEEDFSFSGLDELIASKLDSYLSSITATASSTSPEAETEEAAKLNTHSIPDLLQSLAMPRTTVSTEARETLLARLYHLILCKPLILYEGLVNEYDVEQLIKYYEASRTENERLLTLKVITTYCCSDIEEVSSLVISSFLPLLFGQLKEVETVSSLLRANIMICYASLILCIYDGSGAYGLDETALTILEICEGLANSQEKSQESDVIINGLHAVGVILTIIYHGEVEMNELLEDLTTRIVAFLDCGDLNITKAAGRVIALIYELYDYGDDDEEDEDNEIDDEDFGPNTSPYYDNDHLYSIINSLSTMSSKNVNKKMKKESKSVFRDVLLTMDAYSTTESRLEVLKNPLTLSHLKLSKSRSLAIHSWYSFIRMIHLRYVFNGGLHDNLLSNPELNSLLKKPKFNDKFSKFNDNLQGDDVREGRTFGSDRKRKLNGKQKDIAMSNARAEKLARELGDLTV